jgi:hypothetical protein
VVDYGDDAEYEMPAFRIQSAVTGVEFVLASGESYPDQCSIRRSSSFTWISLPFKFFGSWTSCLVLSTGFSASSEE